MITHAAILLDDVLYLSDRHYKCIAQMNGKKGGKQGFINHDGKFLDRVEALEEAIKCNQIIKKHGSPKQLYSEDLWLTK